SITRSMSSGSPLGDDRKWPTGVVDLEQRGASRPVRAVATAATAQTPGQWLPRGATRDAPTCDGSNGRSCGQRRPVSTIDVGKSRFAEQLFTDGLREADIRQVPVTALTVGRLQSSN